MRPGIGANNMQKRVLLVLFVLIMQPLALADTEDSHESREAYGGHAILLEQYTATWCESCATVDPWITDFVDSHSTRVVRVALHPDDHDPFGSPLTAHRIGIKQVEHQLQLPTFWFDGKGELQGTVSQSLLENELRSAEAERTDWIGMQILWDTWNNETSVEQHELTIQIDEQLPHNSTVSIFRIQSLEMISEIANNGIDIHHDVATQMITFEQKGNVTQSFNGTHGWNALSSNQSSESENPNFILGTAGEVHGFVTIIEENGTIRSVVGIENSEYLRNVEKSVDFGLFLLLLALVASSMLISRKGGI